jgi:tetratricopeptide (TPR) repeat protein
MTKPVTKKRLAIVLAVPVLITGAAVAYALVFKPHLKVIDVVNAKVGIAPTVEELKAAIAKDPKNAQAHLDLGHAWFDGGKWENALAAYDTALALDPALMSDRVATNALACFGTSHQGSAWGLIVKRKLLSTEEGLRTLTADRRHGVRTNAVAALDRLGKAQRADWLRVWIADTKEDSCEVRRNAIDKLGEFGDKSALAAIKRADKKDDGQTAWYALSCLRGRPEEAEKKILARR